jgi:hypothetical protein
MAEWNLQEELESLLTPEDYSIENEVDLGAATAAEVKSTLNGTARCIPRTSLRSASLGVVDAVATSSEVITQQDILDTIKSLLKFVFHFSFPSILKVPYRHADCLQPQQLNKLLDTLCSGQFH